jgi:hypothetical protein
MAWRPSEWAHFDKFDRPVQNEDRATRHVPLGGYCGLAGKP